MARFLRLQPSLPDLNNRWNQPTAHSQALQQYGSALGAWMRANLDWSSQTPRYTNHIPSDRHQKAGASRKG